MAEMLRIFVGLLLITLVAAGHKNCKRGTRVRARDGCNTCICLGHGVLVGCTLRDCSRHHRRLHKREVPGEKKRECTPGERISFDGGCNHCTCSQDGHLGGCTEKACHKYPVQESKSNNSKQNL
uniref:Protease inhibitor n=1 Tax=Panstrongylus lignarius TaxID=156445 RepID=A0A224Y1K9_9HEMI